MHILSIFLWSVLFTFFLFGCSSEILNEQDTSETPSSTQLNISTKDTLYIVNRNTQEHSSEDSRTYSHTSVHNSSSSIVTHSSLSESLSSAPAATNNSSTGALFSSNNESLSSDIQSSSQSSIESSDASSRISSSVVHTGTGTEGSFPQIEERFTYDAIMNVKEKVILSYKESVTHLGNYTDGTIGTDSACTSAACKGEIENYNHLKEQLNAMVHSGTYTESHQTTFKYDLQPQSGIEFWAMSSITSTSSGKQILNIKKVGDHLHILPYHSSCWDVYSGSSSTIYGTWYLVGTSPDPSNADGCTTFPERSTRFPSNQVRTYRIQEQVTLEPNLITTVVRNDYNCYYDDFRSDFELLRMPHESGDTRVSCDTWYWESGDYRQQTTLSFTDSEMTYDWVYSKNGTTCTESSSHTLYHVTKYVNDLSNDPKPCEHIRDL